MQEWSYLGNRQEEANKKFFCKRARERFELEVVDEAKHARIVDVASIRLRSATPHEEHLGTLELNRLRYLLGLSLVRIDPKLSDAARDHSKDMTNVGFFSHTSPVSGKRRFGQRAANFGTSASAENIAAGQRTGPGAIRAWWYSPGHHKNMLGGHGRTGLGQHGSMWTQMFGG